MKIKILFQFVNSKTGIDKLLENKYIYTILLVYQAFSAH